MWSCCLVRLSKLLFQVLSLVRGNRSETLCNQRGHSLPPLAIGIGLPRASISITPGIEVYNTQNITEIQQQMCPMASFIWGKAVTFWAEIPVSSHPCLRQLGLSSGTVLGVQREYGIAASGTWAVLHKTLLGKSTHFCQSKGGLLVN